jgi:hypothetical protein
MSAAPPSLPAVCPFEVLAAMPAENAAGIHLLLGLHTLLTILAFTGGPVMVWQALRNRAGGIFWFFAALPLGIEAQRLLAGDHCVVQDLARELWDAPEGVWAPDLYGVHAS